MSDLSRNGGDIKNMIQSDKNGNLENLEYEELKNLYMNNLKNFHYRSEKPSKQIFSTIIPSTNNYETPNDNNFQNEIVDNSQNYLNHNNNNNINFEPILINNNNQKLFNEIQPNDVLHPTNTSNNMNGYKSNNNFSGNLYAQIPNNNNNDFNNNFNSIEPHNINIYSNQLGNYVNPNYPPNLVNSNPNTNKNPGFIQNAILNNLQFNNDEKSKEKDFKRKKQEEYRKYLDQQLQELNRRKQMDKIQHKGLNQPLNSNNNQQGGILNFPSTSNIKQHRNMQIQIQDFNNLNNELISNNMINPISPNRNSQNYSMHNINKFNNIISNEPKTVDVNNNLNANYNLNNQDMLLDDKNPQLKFNEFHSNLSNQFYQKIDNKDLNNINNYQKSKLITNRDEVLNYNSAAGNNLHNLGDAKIPNQVLPSYNYQDEKKMEKEIEKKKKLDYQEELKRQIQEKENKKKQEKQKIKEEEIKFEEKYGGDFEYFNQQNPKGNKSKPLHNEVEEIFEHKVMGKKPNYHEMRKNNQIDNYQNPKINNDSFNYDKPNFPSDQQQLKQGEIASNNFENMNKYNNANPTALSREYSEFRNNVMSGNNHNLNIPSYTANQNFDYNQGYDENKFKSFQHPQQAMQNINFPFNNYINNNHPFLMSNMGASDTYNLYNQSNMNLGLFNPKNYFPQQQPYMMPPFFEEMMKMFFNQQMKIFQDYKETLDKLSNERDNMKKETLLQQEKYTTLSRLKSQHEQLKSSVGFNPLVNDYNENLENMLETLDYKIINKNKDDADKNNNNNKYQNNKYNKNEEYQTYTNQQDNKAENANELNLNNNKFMNSDDRPLTGVKNQKLIYRNRYYAENVKMPHLTNINSYNKDVQNINNFHRDYDNDQDYEEEMINENYNQEEIYEYEDDRVSNKNFNMNNLYQDKNLNPLDLKYEEFRNKFEDFSQTQTYFNLNMMDKTDREKFDNFNKSIASKNDLLIDVESKLVKITDKKNTPVDMMETWRDDDLMNSSKIANLDRDLDHSKSDQSKLYKSNTNYKEKSNVDNLDNISKNKLDLIEETSNNKLYNFDYKNLNTDLSSKNLVTEFHAKDKSFEDKNNYKNNSSNNLTNKFNPDLNGNHQNKENFSNSKAINQNSSNNLNLKNLKNTNNQKTINLTSRENKIIQMSGIGHQNQRGFNSNKTTQNNYNYSHDGNNIRSQREKINQESLPEETPRSGKFNESQEEILEEENLQNYNNQNQEFEIIENDLKKKRIPENQLKNFNGYDNLQTDGSQINTPNDNINNNVYNIDNSNLKNFNFNKTESYIDPDELQAHQNIFDTSNKNIINNKYTYEDNDEEDGEEENINFKINYVKNYANNENYQNNFYKYEKLQNKYENEEDNNEEAFGTDNYSRENYIESTSNFNTIKNKKDRDNTRPIPMDKAKKDRDKLLNNHQIKEKLQKIKNRNYNSSKNTNFNQSSKNNISSKNDGDSNIIISNSNSQTMKNHNQIHNYREYDNNTNDELISENSDYNYYNQNINSNKNSNKVYTNFQSFDFKKNANINRKLNNLESDNNYEEEYDNMEYTEEFLDENQLKESIKKETHTIDVNLEDYKDIHENQKLQTKLNFFENSTDSNIAKKPNNFSNNNVVNSVIIEKKLKKDDLQTINSNNYKPNPLDRIPRDISSNNIQKLNSIFDKYKGSLNANSNKVPYENKISNNNSNIQENIFSFDKKNKNNHREFDNNYGLQKSQQKHNKLDKQQNQNEYNIEQTRNQLKIMFKNNANNGDIKIRETIDENLNNISNTSNLQDVNSMNNINLNNNKVKSIQKNKGFQLSNSELNNYSNINLVTENSQKQEVKFNKKINNKNYNNFEDSLA